MTQIFKRLLDDRSGATAIEYGLIAALISVGILLGLSDYGQALQAWYEKIRDGLDRT